MSRRISCLLLTLLAVCLSAPAHAHPMGNFAICHYAKFAMSAGKPLRLRYVLDMAEIPALSEKKAMDSNGDGTISAAETAAYLAAAAPRLVSGVSLTTDGIAQTLTVANADLRFSPGAGGLQTLKILLDLVSTNPLPEKGQFIVAYRDTNYATRTGWKEILATTGGGTALQDNSIATTDRSGELTRYPAGVIPPQETEAHFTVAVGISATPSSAAAPLSVRGTSNTATTPRDAFTEAINQKQLTPWVIALGLLVAFIYGGLHGLGPGHGKTMVAAYLVGTRGTPRHAVLLGLIVTVTHTLGVFALGAVTILLEKYIVPERLYPILSAFSGVSVAVVGGWLLYTRLRGNSVSAHHHHHAIDADAAHVHAHAHGLPHTHDHSHSHDHDHHHPHSHDNLDEHGGHDHGFGYHSHAVPEGKITPRTLIALGVSGGIVPCPSALIVLLAAIALNRVGYGLVLVTAFSLGLASVLIAIGLMVVGARNLLERFPRRGITGSRLRTVGRLLPIASAAAITGIGVVLVVRAFLPGTP